MLLHTRPALKIGSHPPTGALAFHVGSSSTFRRHSLPLSLSHFVPLFPFKICLTQHCE